MKSLAKIIAEKKAKLLTKTDTYKKAICEITKILSELEQQEFITKWSINGDCFEIVKNNTIIKLKISTNKFDSHDTIQVNLISKNSQKILVYYKLNNEQVLEEFVHELMDWIYELTCK